MRFFSILPTRPSGRINHAVDHTLQANTYISQKNETEIERKDTRVNELRLHELITHTHTPHTPNYLNLIFRHGFGSAFAFFISFVYSSLFETFNIRMEWSVFNYLALIDDEPQE